ncbi:MAG: hypothetical protein FWB71_05050 [Defluviitaleaceae bacterium]|nr:hypothetical protein [Defluviitaleaceae bacterium]
MKLAALVGISISDFWKMTYKEIRIYAKAYRERTKYESEQSRKMAVLTAYLTSRLVWQKRVDLQKLLGEDAAKSKKAMTDKEMLAAVIARHKAIEQKG